MQNVNWVIFRLVPTTSRRSESCTEEVEISGQQRTNIRRTFTFERGISWQVAAKEAVAEGEDNKNKRFYFVSKQTSHTITSDYHIYGVKKWLNFRLINKFIAVPEHITWLPSCRLWSVNSENPKKIYPRLISQRLRHLRFGIFWGSSGFVTSTLTPLCHE